MFEDRVRVLCQPAYDVTTRRLYPCCNICGSPLAQDLSRGYSDPTVDPLGPLGQDGVLMQDSHNFTFEIRDISYNVCYESQLFTLTQTRSSVLRGVMRGKTFRKLQGSKIAYFTDKYLSIWGHMK